MDTQMIRRIALNVMGKTVKTIDNILADVSQQTATTYRDGGDGWTVLETLCHVRDFDAFFYGRAVMMLEQLTPHLPAYDHDALAIERRYNEQNLKVVLEDLKASRERFITFFEGLSDEEWERDGIHPERGYFTMTDAAMQVATHDISHTEQITKILREKLTAPATV
ncbi:MAG: DinB family protein [Aggregatilineales bacterium]